MLRCRHCGYTAEQEDFEFHKDTGYWCPDCDGFTFFDSAQMPRYWIILEDKQSSETVDTSGSRHVSPLRYPGGKSRLAPYISSLCRQDHMEHFCEPFCGGASVGLFLLLEDKIGSLHINDLDRGVYALFTSLRDEKQYRRLKDLLRRTQCLEKKWFLEARDAMNNGYPGLSLADTAYVFLTLNRMAYSGIVKGGCMSDAQARWNPDTLVKRLDAIHAKADRIFTYNMDALDFIEEKYWLKHCTLFIDPPYYANHAECLYNHSYSAQEHANLSGLLSSLYRSFPCADMIVTYDFCKEIEEMYDDADEIVIGRKYTI